MKTFVRVLAMGLCLAGAGKPLTAALPGDSEAAAHGDEAASLQLVKETEIQNPDFIFRQYNLGVLSHYSYLVASQGEAMIVDPARDISRYLEDAQKLGVKITRVFLTHSHADFVAGHSELAKATGATILIGKAAQAGFPHEPLEDGSLIAFGKVKARVLTTPGHTPDSTCLLIESPVTPGLLLTGDTLFIGSVGRPDLMGGTISAAELASMAWDSWTLKLSKLPNETRIFPAHGAGSLCGAHLSDKPDSTLGEQKRDNAYLQYKDRNSFIMAMISGLPDAPQYFSHNAKMNHDGPPLVAWDANMPPLLSPSEARQKEEAGGWLIDLGDAEAFAAGHAANAINIGIRGRFETWTGIMVPWGAPFVLVGSDEEVREAAFRLHRIGYDAPAGYLAGGTAAWKGAGQPVATITLVRPAELAERIKEGKAPILVDVRLPSEWMGLRIADNMLNYPINTLASDSRRLAKAMPVMTICNSAYRSSMGAAILQKEGFTDVYNLEGGSEAWIDAGLPTLGAAPAQGAALPAPGVYLKLPEPMSSADLARRLMDLPGSLEVVDIRPAWQFAEYHVPSAQSVPVEQLLNNPAYLVDKRPLVVVCRDGSISASVAGALMQKGTRPIRYLLDGTARYYDDIQRPGGIRSEAAPLPLAEPAVQPPPPGPASPAPAAPMPPAPRKKSAGC